MEKTSSGKTGPCINCGRTKFIADKFGHCSSCSLAVKDLDPGSAAYTSALAAAKERLSSGNVERAKQTRRKKLISPEKIEKAKMHARSLTVKHRGGDLGTSNIVAMLEIEKENLLARVQKIDTAIALLS